MTFFCVQRYFYTWDMFRNTAITISHELTASYYLWWVAAEPKVEKLVTFHQSIEHSHNIHQNHQTNPPRHSRQLMPASP
jgi:hypothetical protein